MWSFEPSTRNKAQTSRVEAEATYNLIRSKQQFLVLTEDAFVSVSSAFQCWLKAKGVFTKIASRLLLVHEVVHPTRIQVVVEVEMQAEELLYGTRADSACSVVLACHSRNPSYVHRRKRNRYQGSE